MYGVVSTFMVINVVINVAKCYVTLPKIVKSFYFNTRYIFAVAYTILSAIDSSYMGVMLGVISFYNFYYDKDDEDRWNKRKKRIKEAVTVVDGKLAVVPT